MLTHSSKNKNCIQIQRLLLFNKSGQFALKKENYSNTTLVTVQHPSVEGIFWNPEIQIQRLLLFNKTVFRIEHIISGFKYNACYCSTDLLKMPPSLLRIQIQRLLLFNGLGRGLDALFPEIQIQRLLLFNGTYTRDGEVTNHSNTTLVTVQLDRDWWNDPV